MKVVGEHFMASHCEISFEEQLSGVYFEIDYLVVFVRSNYEKHSEHLYCLKCPYCDNQADIPNTRRDTTPIGLYRSQGDDLSKFIVTLYDEISEMIHSSPSVLSVWKDIVDEYVEAFKVLLAQVSQLFKDQYMGFFLGGLHYDICIDVLSFEPPNHHSMIAL
ncbi:hypothetical protein VNO78_23001 [Psophocarpus tetragonolobus]|uniref:Uncharacterized protein n=1 Tax=Psophocarpus tetragonolobus TaxID=3891 RepID=A0AAN9S3D4_PSOTE